jgi:hypothetical protein
MWFESRWHVCMGIHPEGGHNPMWFESRRHVCMGIHSEGGHNSRWFESLLSMTLLRGGSAR